MASLIQRKQPNENIPSVMDFVKVLPAGESIDSGDVVITDPEGVDVTTAMRSKSPTVVGSQVQSAVQGGDDGKTYKITFVATTDPSGYVFEEDVDLEVAER